MLNRNQEQARRDYSDKVNEEMYSIRDTSIAESRIFDAITDINRINKNFHYIFGEATQNTIAIKYSADFMRAFFNKDKDAMYDLFNYMVCHYECSLAEDAIDRALEDQEENEAEDKANAKAESINARFDR